MDALAADRHLADQVAWVVVMALYGALAWEAWLARRRLVVRALVATAVLVAVASAHHRPLVLIAAAILAIAVVAATALRRARGSG